MDKSRLGIIFVICVIFADIFIWWQIVAFDAPRPGDYFLNVGQGDGELVVLPDGTRILTDAGPDASVVGEIEKILPVGDRYVDVAIVSHPQADHYNGFNHLLDSVRIGVFAWNGRNDDPSVASWSALVTKIRMKNVPMVTLMRGDRIRVGTSEDDILSPDGELDTSAELNDTGLVEFIKTPVLKTLLTADIGMNVERFLLGRRDDIRADVLKIAHHGSKYSSSQQFLRAVMPSIAVVEVGARNTYGHPAAEVLARISSFTGARIFRTDKDGTTAIFPENGKLIVRTEK